jgi:hypothetical protein
LSRALTTISSTASKRRPDRADRVGGESVIRRRGDGQREQNSDGRPAIKSRWFDMTSSFEVVAPITRGDYPQDDAS